MVIRSLYFYYCLILKTELITSFVCSSSSLLTLNSRTSSLRVKRDSRWQTYGVWNIEQCHKHWCLTLQWEQFHTYYRYIQQLFNWNQVFWSIILPALCFQWSKTTDILVFGKHSFSQCSQKQQSVVSEAWPATKFISTIKYVE